MSEEKRNITACYIDPAVIGLKSKSTPNERLNSMSYMSDKQHLLLKVIEKRRTQIKELYDQHKRFFLSMAFTSPQEYRVCLVEATELDQSDSDIPDRIKQDVRFREYVNTTIPHISLAIYVYDVGNRGFTASVINLPWIDPSELIDKLKEQAAK